jgi:hypothetical protein
VAALLAGCPTGDDTTGGDTTAPAEVSNLGGTAGDGSVTLTWIDPPDADLDHLEITWTGGATVLKVAAGEQTRTITGLGNGTTYTFTVQTVDASGNKSAGQTIDLSPAGPNPFTDTNVVWGLFDIDATSATLTWTDPPDAALDHIEVTWTPGGDTPQTAAKGTQTATINGLISDTSYTFTVRAVDTGGNKSGGITVTLIPNKLQKWTRVISAEDGNPFGSTQITVLRYGGDRFVAVGGRKTAWSTDGVTWTAGTDSTFNIPSQSIIWGGTSGQEKFVAVGSSGKMAWSTNGASWTAVTDSTFGSSAIRDITWGGASGQEKFVAVGYSGKMAWSTDGVTWIAGTDSAFGSSHVYSIAWGGTSGEEKFVAGGASGKMAWSTDGVTWTAVTDTDSMFNEKNIYYIIYGGSAGQKRFFARTADSGYGFWSVDGIQWVAEAVPTWPSPIGPQVSPVHYMAWGGGKTVVNMGTSFVYYGPDTASLADLNRAGVTFPEGITAFFNGYDPNGSSITGIAWGGPPGQERFVIAGNSGFAYSEIFSD